MSAAREVVVIGAGLAGAAAAWRLAAAGQRVAWLERAAEPGGRAAPGPTGADPFAAGVRSSDRALLGLVDALGVAGEALPLAPESEAQLDAGRLALVGGEGWRALARVPGVPPLEALRAVRLPRLLARYAPSLDPSRPEAAAPLDDRSLRDFGALYLGRRAVSHWMEPWLAARAPVDERETSRAHFLLRYASERGSSGGRLRVPPARIAAAVAERVPLRLRAVAERIEAAGARLRIAIAGAEPLLADAVVVATPAEEALRLAAPLLVHAERDVLGAAAFDAAFVWSAPVRRPPVSASMRVRLPRAAGTPFSALVLDPDRVTAVAREPFCGARLAAPDEAVAKELAAELARAMPSLDVDAGRAALARFPLAWPRFGVGRYRALARLRAVQEDRRRSGRRLYLAGDHLVGPTLDAAVRSGLRAADDLLADAGVAAAPPLTPRA